MTVSFEVLLLNIEHKLAIPFGMGTLLHFSDTHSVCQGHYLCSSSKARIDRYTRCILLRLLSKTRDGPELCALLFFFSDPEEDALKLHRLDMG